MRTAGIGRWVYALAAAIFTLAASVETGAQTVQGTVKDASGQAVSRAMVYLVPAADVAKLAKAPSYQIRRNVDNDEPMEDNIAANGDKYLQAVTGIGGGFSINKVADGKYFVYVAPTDRQHLPGGNLANKARTVGELTAKPLAIQVSGRIPEDAVFVGSSKCLTCHTDYGDVKKTLHKLGIAVVGKPGKLQDFSRFPGFNAGLDKLSAGLKLYLHSFDKGRGFDKYVISEKPPADPSTVSFTATFFKDPDGTVKFRTENARDASDPPRTYPVEMTYGGGLYKQRYLFRVGDATYPFVQFNPTGNDAYADRTRKPWRDYHGDWLYNETTKKLADPPKTKSFEIQCAACHFNGYTLTPTVGGDFVAGAVNDPNGESDIDGDGVPNELNLGCEGCHGAGSAHVRASKLQRASTIVNPAKLAAERAMVICNQCHSRPQGTMKNDQPINKDNRMLTPGISRNEYLVNHTTREDAAQSDFWGDGAHSKAHHQQGTDLVRSKKYINATQTLTCADCHDPHGKTGLKHQVKMEVRDDKNSLCASCHKGVDTKTHTAKSVGFEHEQINCISCHMTKTMQTGAGLGKGLDGKDGKNYWMNDITSHLFDVPRKVNPAVKGVEPGKAMPIPYTNACGSCHQADKL